MPVTAANRTADFADVPPGSIPASRTGVYRHDHFTHRDRVYAAHMQQQMPRENDVIRQQQMQQQCGSRLD